MKINSDRLANKLLRMSNNEMHDFIEVNIFYENVEHERVEEMYYILKEINPDLKNLLLAKIHSMKLYLDPNYSIKIAIGLFIFLLTFFVNDYLKVIPYEIFRVIISMIFVTSFFVFLINLIDRNRKRLIRLEFFKSILINDNQC